MKENVCTSKRVKKKQQKNLIVLGLFKIEDSSAVEELTMASVFNSSGGYLVSLCVRSVVLSASLGLF